MIDINVHVTYILVSLQYPTIDNGWSPVWGLVTLVFGFSEKLIRIMIDFIYGLVKKMLIPVRFYILKQYKVGTYFYFLWSQPFHQPQVVPCSTETIVRQLLFNSRPCQFLDTLGCGSFWPNSGILTSL